MNAQYIVMLGSGGRPVDGRGGGVMDGIAVEIDSWPQAAVAVTFILASMIVPQVLGYLKDRRAVPKVEVTRSEPDREPALAPRVDANLAKTILEKIRAALYRCIN